MVDDRQQRGEALGRFTVDRVVKDDGRYLLYYSWPESPLADAGGTPAPGAAMEDASDHPRADV